MAIAHREREHAAVIDAHELRDFGIVGGGAERAAERGAIEEQIEGEDHRDRGERSVSSGMTPTATPPPSGIEAVSIAPASSRRLSAENASSSPFWIDDRQAEGHQQRRQDVAAERAVEQHDTASA